MMIHFIIGYCFSCYLVCAVIITWRASKGKMKNAEDKIFELALAFSAPVSVVAMVVIFGIGLAMIGPFRLYHWWTNRHKEEWLVMGREKYDWFRRLQRQRPVPVMKQKVWDTLDASRQRTLTCVTPGCDNMMSTHGCLCVPCLQEYQRTNGDHCKVDWPSLREVVK